jgi:hypothetical protein
MNLGDSNLTYDSSEAMCMLTKTERNFMARILHACLYFLYEIGGTCSTHGRNEKYIKISVEKSERPINSEDLGVDGRIILEWILGK